MDLDEPNKQLYSDLNPDNILNYPANTTEVRKDSVLPEYRMELTTKRAVELFLEGTLRTKVCRYCLNVASPLSELDQILQIAGKGVLHKVTIRDMVASFYPFKVLNDSNFPSRICNKCLNRTISAYLFTQQCEQSERALHNCFEDMYNKLEKLDPLERTKKRGRQKQNPNYNILYTDHQRVIDYAEPMINIVNLQSVSLSDEKYITDLECPKCWQIFTKIDDLIIHEKSHPNNMWFNCRLCGKSFVKRMQLKRHWKQEHRDPETKPEIIEKTDFQCGTCGFKSDDHSIYLQHIEKHKFQSVLEHLVEKNMDKLCAVCLDKPPKLVELDKMVRLHGGYPGVTGDKTLYSILGSTLPDHKSYKYQELYVPHHAKIMKFAKLTKEKQSQIKTVDNSGSNVNQIIISNPLIISNDNFDCEEMFLFFFSDPSYYKDDVKENSVEEQFPNEAVVQYEEEYDNSLAIKEMNNNLAVSETPEENINQNDSTENMHDSLSIKDVEIKNNVLDANGIKNATKVYTSCRTCWIFNKPTCKTYISNQMHAEQKLADVENRFGIECKYCWIFKTSGKCGYCNNNIDSITSNNINTITDYKDTKMGEDKNANLQRKRKLIDDAIKHEKKKWDCQICLTTNIEECQTCICCESNRHNQGNLTKVNLNTEHPFKMFKTHDTTTNQDKVRSNILKTLETVTNECGETDKIVIITSMPAVNATNMLMNDVEFEGTYSNSDDNNDNFKPFALSNIDVLTGKVIEKAEEMDIADDNDSQFVIPLNPNPFSFNGNGDSSNVALQLKNIERSSNILVQDSGLRFNIGAGCSKGQTARRIARPIRRMAYHK